MSFGPKYDGSDVLYWDRKVRPYLPTTDNPWKELFRTGWNQTRNPPKKRKIPHRIKQMAKVERKFFITMPAFPK